MRDKIDQNLNYLFIQLCNHSLLWPLEVQSCIPSHVYYKFKVGLSNYVTILYFGNIFNFYQKKKNTQTLSSSSLITKLPLSLISPSTINNKKL